VQVVADLWICVSQWQNEFDFWLFFGYFLAIFLDFHAQFTRIFT